METESVSEPVSSTAGIDDLITDQTGIEPSAPVAAQPEPSQEPQVTQAQEPISQEPAAAPSQAPVTEQTPTLPQTIRLGDRDYTPQELQAALTSAQQLPHLQQKYVGLLEQAKQGQSAQQQATVPQATPQAALQAIRAKYDPVVQQGVKDGVIEQDFATLFPGMAAQMLMYRDGFQQLAQQVGGVAQVIQQNQQQAQSQGVVNDMGNAINQLSQSGDAFAPLKDSNQVRGFMQYLWDLNPQVHQVKNPAFLANQWVAYNRDKFLQNAQTQQVQNQRQAQLRMAQGAGTGNARSGGFGQEPAPTPLDQMVQDFLERSS